MRRIALLLVPALLAGCGTLVGNPADGLGGFAGRVLSFNANANRPVLDSPNARRAMGVAETTEALEEESGNVWPGPLPPARTMSDMQRDLEALPPIDAPAPAPRSSAAPPPSVTLPPVALPAPRPFPTLATPAASASRVLQTPGGLAVTSVGSNGVETYTLPTGRTGIVMPNANGTLTLIGPDGTTQIIAAPR